MLQHLLVKNYVLIEHLELIPSPSLSVITGETGAGKSILLTVLGMIMGQRNPSRTLCNESKKCVMEGTFDIREYGLKRYFERHSLPYDAITLLRREILPTGKSRAFVNDTPVPLDVLRQLGHRLVDIHAQDDTSRLLQGDFQRALIDHYGGHEDLLRAYQRDYTTYKKACEAYSALRSAAEKAAENEDYHRYVHEELRNAGFKAGEKEILEDKVKRLNHAEQISGRLSESIKLLEQEPEGGLMHHLATLVSLLSQLSAYDKAYMPLKERLNSLHVESQDIARDLSAMAEDVSMGPEEAEAIRARLDLLYHLLKKHKVDSVEALLDLQKRFEKALSEVENHGAALATLEASKNQAYARMQASGKALSEARQKQSKPFAKAAEKILQQLGMPQARFDVTVSKTEAHDKGIDEIHFTFSANKGFGLKPLKDIASGGERSRLMFVMKYLFAQKKGMPTLIFDEIDTGISGQIAITMAHMMKEMSAHHQIITVSHLPQFASQADRHFLIYKSDTSEKTLAHVQVLKGEARIKAIAEMIDGHTPSEHAMRSARHMIEK